MKLQMLVESILQVDEDFTKEVHAMFSFVAYGLRVFEVNRPHKKEYSIKLADAGAL